MADRIGFNNRVDLDDLDLAAMIDVLQIKKNENGFTNCENHLLNYFVALLKMKGYSIKKLESGDNVFDYVYGLIHDVGFEDLQSALDIYTEQNLENDADFPSFYVPRAEEIE